MGDLRLRGKHCAGAERNDFAVAFEREVRPAPAADYLDYSRMYMRLGASAGPRVAMLAQLGDAADAVLRKVYCACLRKRSAFDAAFSTRSSHSA